MGGARKLSLALAAALCAAVFAACGGDDDSSTGTATDPTTAESTVEAGGSSNQTGGGDKGGGSKDGAGGEDGGGAGAGGDGGDGDGSASGTGDGGSGGDSGKGNSSKGIGQGAPTFTGPPTKHKHPAPEDGDRSGPFRVAGGDNSIQDYGEEQDAEERAEATKPIAALYAALESGEWGVVCSTHLSSPNLQQIELLAEKSPQIKGQSCAQVLGGLNQSFGRQGPDTPDGAIVSFRVEGDTGFAIWWGIDGKGYAMPLKSEGGAWKLTSLAPTPLQVG